jgi:hypothetical protein
MLGIAKINAKYAKIAVHLRLGGLLSLHGLQNVDPTKETNMKRISLKEAIEASKREKRISDFVVFHKDSQGEYTIIDKYTGTVWAEVFASSAAEAKKEAFENYQAEH